MDVGFVNDTTRSLNKPLSPEKQLIYVVACDARYDDDDDEWKRQCVFFNSLDLTLGWVPSYHLYHPD